MKMLKQKANQTLAAKNQHELMHCLEVLNLLELGELLLCSANARTETRGGHVRLDCPFTNPLMDQRLILKKGDHGPEYSWREVKR